MRKLDIVGPSLINAKWHKDNESWGENEVSEQVKGKFCQESIYEVV